MGKIHLVPIDRNNLGVAISLAKEIFPYEISRDGIFLPEEEYRLSLNAPRANLQQFFVVEYEGQLVGITGYNFNYRRHRSEELWLGYFGVRQEFRGNGIGKKILLETIELMQKFNPDLRTVKLYTSNRPEEKGSHQLYRCLGFRVYAHKSTKPFHTYYFRKSIRP